MDMPVIAASRDQERPPSSWAARRALRNALSAFSRSASVSTTLSSNVGTLVLLPSLAHRVDELGPALFGLVERAAEAVPDVELPGPVVRLLQEADHLVEVVEQPGPHHRLGEGEQNDVRGA